MISLIVAPLVVPAIRGSGAPRLALWERVEMIDRRRFLAGSALLALTTQATGASAQAPSPEKKTYVLVPGAFWGG